MTTILSRTLGLLTVILTSQCILSSALCTVSPRPARNSALFFSRSSTSHHANVFNIHENQAYNPDTPFRNSLIPVPISRPVSRRTTLIGTTNGETDTISSQGVLSIMKSFWNTHYNRDKIDTKIVTVRNTLKEGGGSAVGSRGERYVGIQMVLLLLFALNKVPLLDALVTFILGPVVTFAGFAIGFRALQELGIANWSPYILPNVGTSTKSFQSKGWSLGKNLKSSSTNTTKPLIDSNTTLVTTGLYSYVRHPIYTGTITFCLGLSSWTNSSFRLLLSLVLAYTLNLKSDVEEAWLEKHWGTSWRTYSKEVKGKFVPDDWIQRLPWMNQTALPLV